MGDIQETASEANSIAKAGPSRAVADLLRTHPSKPAPAASPLLQSALGFEAVPDDEAANLDGADEIADDRDAMSTSRGILFGLALMVPFWGAVGMAIRTALR